MKKLFKAVSICFLLSILFTSCTKEENRKACWQVCDYYGYDAPIAPFCNKTKAQAQAAACPNCLVYNTNEPKFCWKLIDTTDKKTYFTDLPQSIADIVFSNQKYIYTKVDCNSYCIWSVFELRKSKITNQFSENRVYLETFDTDTCSKLFVNRKVIHRETADTIVTREFTRKLH